MQFEVEVEGLNITLNKLDKIGGNLVKLSPAMDIIGKSLAKYYGGVAFQSKGSVFDKPWAELAPSTIAYKAKHFRGRPDMVRTSELRNSFDYSYDDTSVTIGNTASYFDYHQSDENRTGDLPQRVMIGINTSVGNLVNTVINDHLKRVIEEATK